MALDLSKGNQAGIFWEDGGAEVGLYWAIRELVPLRGHFRGLWSQLRADGSACAAVPPGACNFSGTTPAARKKRHGKHPPKNFTDSVRIDRSCGLRHIRHGDVLRKLRGRRLAFCASGLGGGFGRDASAGRSPLRHVAGDYLSPEPAEDSFSKN